MDSTSNDLSSCSNGNSASTNGSYLTHPAQPKQHEFAMWNSVGPAVNRLATSASFKPEDEGLSLTSRSYTEHQLGAKVDMVYGLISMLDNQNRDEMTRTLLAMSHSSDRCDAMRQSGCISLLVQLIHSEEEDCTPELRDRAAQALHNLIHCHQDDKQGRREVRVLGLLEKIRHYADTMSDTTEHTDQEGQIIGALMKLSFDEDHRSAMCQLGALHTLAKLMQVDTHCHGLTNKYCIVLRRYAGMTLTNLTFGQGNNKSTLCCLTDFMKALVLQLSTPSDHLRQVTASVLRNLSWRADAKSKQILREVGAVPALMKSAMEASKESTLKSILSALWNFSAHCNENKIDICQVDGALPFLIEKMKSSTATSLTIVENAGGVMRNISSHISVKENYREILRQQAALPLLLEQLRSPSLTVVSNACGTLWNLSARCPQDQATLCSLGAGPMLSCLIHSRHKMIAMGASATLKNLLAAQPTAADSTLLDNNSKGMPTLLIRKRKALEKELDANLAETCDNIENAELASPLTPQSVPVSTLTSHHMKTSTPNSSVHSLTGNHNTADHSPLTRSITPSPTPSLSHHNTTTPTSTSHYNPADESHRADLSHYNIADSSHHNTTIPTSTSQYKTADQPQYNPADQSHYSIADNSHHNTNTPTSSSHYDPADDREDLASNYSIAISERGYHTSHTKTDDENTTPSDRQTESRNNYDHTVAQIDEMTSKMTISDEQYSRDEKLVQESNYSPSNEESNEPYQYSRPDIVNSPTNCIDNRVELAVNHLSSSSNHLDSSGHNDSHNSCTGEKGNQFDDSQTEEQENSQFLPNEHRKSPSGYNSTDENFHRSANGDERSHNSSTDSTHEMGANFNQNLSQKSDTSQRSDNELVSEAGSHFNTSNPSDLEREQLSFSKMEEPYYHPHLDEDSNEPIHLDQPTNYSLRYSEKQKRLDATSNDAGRRGTKFNEDHEGAASDCLKTFCTEDTPYNFSNSTSLSDLRITEGDGGELSACKTPDDSKPPSGRQSPGVLKLSPGTPGPRGDPDETPLMFSRCSSLGSVSSCGENGEQGVHNPRGDDSSVPAEDRYSVVSEFSRMTSGMISPSDLPDSPIHTVPVSPSPRSGAKFTFPPGSNLPHGANLPRGKNPAGENTGKFTSGVESSGVKGPHQRPSVFEDTVATYKDEDDEMEESGVNPSSSLQPSSLPPPPSAKDELKCYAVEESPLNLTAWSSLSDLTINTNTSVSATQPRQYGEGERREVFGREGGGQMQFIGDHVSSSEQGVASRSGDARDTLGDLLVGGDGERIVGGHLGRDLCTNGERPPVENIVGERLIGGDLGGSEESKENLNDEQILAACIQAGMQSAKAAKKKDDIDNKTSSHHLYSSEEDEEDCHALLAQCIQLGMSSTNRSQPKPTNSKPAPSNQSASKSLSSTILDSSQEDDGDEALLAQCIQLGMSSTRSQKQSTKQRPTGSSSNERTLNPGAAYLSTPAKPVTSSPSKLLAGPNPSHSAPALDLSDEDILQQCILEGMSPYVAEASSDESLLAECIRAGMKKYKQEMCKRKQASASPSSSPASQPMPQPRDTNDQTSRADFDLDQWANDGQEDSALLLEQCIQAGISHKSKNVRAPSVTPRSPRPTDGDPTVDDTSGELLDRSDTHLLDERSKNLDMKCIDSVRRTEQDQPIMNDESKNEMSKEVVKADKLQEERGDAMNSFGTARHFDANSTKTNAKPDRGPNNLERRPDSLERRPSRAENKLISSLIRSSGSLEKSMERSWLMTENLNDDLCEGLDTSGSPNEEEFIHAGVGEKDETCSNGSISDGTKFESEKFDNKESLKENCSENGGKSPTIRTLESRLVSREVDEMKASLTNTWSEDSSTSYPTVSLSPPSCLKPTTFVYGGKSDGKNSHDGKKHTGKISTEKFPVDGESGIRFPKSECDSLTSSPARKSVALVNPFPETAKHWTPRVPEIQCGDKANLIDELVKKSYGGNALHNQESIVLMNADVKCSPHILELECGKLGLISSLEFEDLNAVKPPSMMDSITCMDSSIFNKALIGSMTSMHSSINLDSVKPPSYFDEVSLMLGDSSLDASICNIDSIVSEVADDDDDVTLVEDDIPLDPQIVSLEHREAYQQSPLLRRKVSPKQKRSLSKERYNTFTIRQSPSPSPPPSKLTPKQRRELNRDRYSTRTIEDNDEINHDTFLVTDDTLTLMSGNNSEIEDLEFDDEPVQMPQPVVKHNNSSINNNNNNSINNKNINRASSPGKTSKLQTPRAVKLPQYKTETPPAQKSSIPAPVKSTLPLQRQGTFTKDEPSHIPLPSVSAGSTPKKNTPTNSGTKQSGTVPGVKLRNNSQPNIKRPGFRSSLSNSNLKGELKDSRFNTSTPGALNRRSYIDLSSARAVDYGRIGARTSQSNSSSSLNSAGSSTCVKQPASGKTPGVVTSKIANLWKKVEDSKKVKTAVVKKDTRVWISK